MSEVSFKPPPGLLRNVVIAMTMALATSTYVAIMLQSMLGLAIDNAFNVFTVLLFISLSLFSYAAYVAVRTDDRLENMSDAQGDVQTRPDWMFVSDRIVQRLVMRMFNAAPIAGKINEELLVVTRRDSIMVLWLPLITCWTIAYLITLVPGLILKFLRSIAAASTTESNTSSVLHLPDLPFGFTMLYLLVVACTSLLIWLKWVSTFVVLTDKHYTLRTQYPSWFNWLGEFNPDMLMKDVGTLGVKQSLLGKLLGFGTLMLDTPSEEAKKVRVITKVPHVDVIAAILRDVQTTFQR